MNGRVANSFFDPLAEADTYLQQLRRKRRQTMRWQSLPNPLRDIFEYRADEHHVPRYSIWTIRRPRIYIRDKRIMLTVAEFNL